MRRYQDSQERDSGGHALLWATLGAIAATYAHRRYYKSRGASLAINKPSQGLMTLVDNAGASGQPIPDGAAQNLSSSARLPIPEDPYPPGNPTMLPTGPAPGG